MDPRVKGGLFLVIAIIGVIIGWQVYSPELAINKNPQQFDLISRMEKEGLPDFESDDLAGNKIRLKDFKDKVVLVNFWASWCNPCVEEFPSMLKLVEHFKGDVILLAISGDESVADIKTFMKALKIENPHIRVIWDKDQNIAKLYGVNKLPESYLADRNGRLVRKIIGIDNWYTPGAIEFFKDLVAGVKVSPANEK